MTKSPSSFRTLSEVQESLILKKHSRGLALDDLRIAIELELGSNHSGDWG